MTTIAFSPNGLLGAGTENGRVVVWRPDDGDRVGEPIQAATGAIDPLSFSPDGNAFVASSADGSVTMWQLESRKRIGNSFPMEQGVVPLALFAPNDDVVIDYLADAAQWPTSLERWERFACQVAGRDLTRAEWAGLLPNRPYQPIRPQ